MRERDNDDNQDVETNDNNHGKVDPDDKTEPSDSDLYVRPPWDKKADRDKGDNVDIEPTTTTKAS